MGKVEKLIKSLNDFIQKAEDKEVPITDIVPDFAGLELLPAIIDDYETAIAKLLREQRKYFLDGFNNFVAKTDTMTIESFFIYMFNDLFIADKFAEKMGEETAKFLKLTIEELTKLIMDSIDKDVPFELLSVRTTNWIEGWSQELADLMQLHTHKALEKELIKVIQEGESIAQAELRMKDLPQFDRNRARATSRTEILTASSQAHYESFMQSPSVIAKKWKHSGSKNITPRETHVAMDGVEIPVEDLFLVDGEFGLYPRDISFSARNRVNCGCVIGPVVDRSILGLSVEEKEEIRRQVLEELDK